MLSAQGGIESGIGASMGALGGTMSAQGAIEGGIGAIEVTAKS